MPIVLDRTRALWAKQDQPAGDRHRLFDAVANAVDATTVLYPGSYVDLAPAFVWPSVTFVDVDRRANQFFADVDGVRELIEEHRADTGADAVRFVHADYQEPLDLTDGSFDLLISLYAGFISEHCTRYLRVGGHLLVNSSHGDAAMASIDRRYRLSAVITAPRRRLSGEVERPRFLPGPEARHRGDQGASPRDRSRRRLHEVAVRLPVRATTLTGGRRERRGTLQH